MAGSSKVLSQQTMQLFMRRWDLFTCILMCNKQLDSCIILNSFKILFLGSLLLFPVANRGRLTHETGRQSICSLYTCNNFADLSDIVIYD